MTTISVTPASSGPISSGPAAAAAPASTPDSARLHKAAQAFEAIFVRQMLASARASHFGDTPGSADGGSTDPGKDTFTQMRDERLADITAQSGALGLAKNIEAQLAARLPQKKSVVIPLPLPVPVPIALKLGSKG